MESMRDINRVMEREIAKGSSPLKLDHIEFGDYSYQEITSEKKLEDVLSYLLRIRDFRQYAGKTILNNVYMDLRGRKPIFKRTRTAIERNNIIATIKRYAKKLMEMCIWKQSDAISICHKKIWRSTDIHIREMKHTPLCYQINILWHCIHIVWWQEKWQPLKI